MLVNAYSITVKYIRCIRCLLSNEPLDKSGILYIYIFLYIKYIHTYKVYYYSESTASITPPFRDNSVLRNECRSLSQDRSTADQELFLLIVNLPKFLQDDIFIVDPQWMAHKSMKRSE